MRICSNFYNYESVIFSAKNVLSCIQAKLDSIKAKLTNEKHLTGESIEKRNTRQSIDERNNNSDYEEPCKRPKIDLGSCSPIHPVREHFVCVSLLLE